MVKGFSLVILFLGLGIGVFAQQTGNEEELYKLDTAKIEKKGFLYDFLKSFFNDGEVESKGTVKGRDSTLTPQDFDTEIRRSLRSGYRNEKDWAKDFGYQAKSLQVQSKSNLNKEVYGYHPFWKGNAYYNYDFGLLTRVGYIGYIVNPLSGSYKSTHSWKSTAMVRLAHNNGCNVDLVVSNHGYSNNRTFLSNPRAWKVLADSVSHLIYFKSADGVNLDFRNIPSDMALEFQRFVIEISAHLHAQNPNYKVSLSVPGQADPRVFNMKILQNHVEQFILHGYEYHGEFSEIAGPNAPLFSGSLWGSGSINQSVTGYLKQGLEPRKLVLGIPYFGKEYSTNSALIGASVIRFVGNKSLDELKAEKIFDRESIFDPISLSPYVVIRDGENYRQIWFENKESLSYKYAYILEKELGGVAFWTLADGMNNPFLSDLITGYFTYEGSLKTNTDINLDVFETMGAPDSLGNYEIESSIGLESFEEEFLGYEETKPELLKFKSWVLIGMCILFGFGVIGFLIVLFDPEFRSRFIENANRVAIYGILLIAGAFLILRVYKFNLGQELVLIAGIALGFILAFGVLKPNRRKGLKERP